MLQLRNLQSTINWIDDVILVSFLSPLTTRFWKKHDLKSLLLRQSKTSFSDVKVMYISDPFEVELRGVNQWTQSILFHIF